MSTFFETPLVNGHLVRAARSIPNLLLKSIAPSTIKRYAYGFKHWTTWRRSHPEIPCLPVSGQHLAVYIAVAIQKNCPFGRVDSVCLGLSWLHRALGLQNPCDSSTVTMLREAAKRILSKAVRKKEPLSPKDLRALAQRLRFGTLIDLRTLTVAVLSYAGFLRFDEVSTLRANHITFEPGYVRLFIDHSKTDQHNEGREVLIAKIGSFACPVGVLRSYMKRARVTKGFIFRPLQSTRGTHVLRKADKSISYSTLRSDMLKALADLGLDKSKFGLHSLRRGGATQAANAGVSDRLFKKHGRWASENAKDGYVEESVDALLSVSRSLGL